eukprot:6190495-Pleurochrysis_carterae.AAC.7
MRTHQRGARWWGSSWLCRACQLRRQCRAARAESTVRSRLEASADPTSEGSFSARRGSMRVVEGCWDCIWKVGLNESIDVFDLREFDASILHLDVNIREVGRWTLVLHVPAVSEGGCEIGVEAVLTVVRVQEK